MLISACILVTSKISKTWFSAYYLMLFKSPTSNKRWPDNMFISGGHPHFQSRFCGAVLGPTTVSKIYLLSSNMQVIGWSMWFSEYLFLERNWAKDERTLKVWTMGYSNIIHMYAECSQEIHICTCYININVCAVRPTATEGFPSSLLASSLCRRNSLYTGQTISRSGICNLDWIACS
jgi:hypothetical protein